MAPEYRRVGWCGWSGRGVASAHAVPDAGGPGQKCNRRRSTGGSGLREEPVLWGGGGRETAAPWGRRGVGSVDAHWLRR